MENQRFKANVTHNSKFKTYLTASEYFLQQRNFEDCRNYVLKAIEIDSNQTSPSQILAIANVLLLSTTINEDPNYYSILNLPLYTQNRQLIKTHFTNVTNLLNPNKNRYPFASEAFGVVLKAWSVLSNPTQKTRFDNGLRNRGEDRGSFWTVCPYCYYVYEFLKDYEDCCLRCQNEKCRRVFHGMPIVGPSPPPEVAEKGEYHCFGFTVLGNGTHPLWSPFVATKTNENNVDEFIEISDDEDENGGNEKTLGVKEVFVKTNGVEVDMRGDFKEKRVKMVGKSLNKVLGKGNKVTMNEIVYNEGNDDIETNENTVEFGNVGDNNVGFFVGDDIYVSMQEEFDIVARASFDIQKARMSSSKSKTIDNYWERLADTREQIDKQTNDLKNTNVQQENVKDKYEATTSLWKLKDKEDQLEDKLEKRGVPKRMI